MYDCRNRSLYSTLKLQCLLSLTLTKVRVNGIMIKILPTYSNQGVGQALVTDRRLTNILTDLEKGTQTSVLKEIINDLKKPMKMGKKALILMEYVNDVRLNYIIYYMNILIRYSSICLIV
jgi:hypothetical protein